LGQKALIVIDMLNDFLDPGGSLYMGAQARKIIPFVARQIAEFRAQGRLVIFVCDAHAPDDPEFSAFPAHAVKGSWGAGIIPELTPAPGDYRVDKTRHSAFDDTNLDDLLQEEQVEEVHLMGVLTSICVLATVRDLFHRKLPGQVYRQGVADTDPEAHAGALQEMEQVLGVKVV
jgi:nicotinamidase-related amidase